MSEDPAQVEAIRARLAAVRQRIAEAAVRANRAPNAIMLVAVSKTHGPEAVRAAVEAGQAVFGENRIEEAAPKLHALADLPGLEWHMIGHVQSRKARQVAEADFALIHSVDTAKLAQRLSAEAAQSGRQQAILLEVNVSGEASKAGFAAVQRETWPALLAEVRTIVALPGLDVRGLMTMAPQVAAPEQSTDQVRPYFERLRQLRDFLADSLARELDTLSMGMTDDFEAAIEAGATIVRIGRAIFGERG